MKIARRLPPIPKTVWFATFVVTSQCLLLGGVLLVAMSEGALTRPKLVGGLTLLVPTAVLAGCQFLATRHRSWIAAGVTGITFTIVGLLCLASLAATAAADRADAMPLGVHVLVTGLVGVWCAANLSAGLVMLRSSRRLYRWRTVWFNLPPLAGG